MKKTIKLEKYFEVRFYPNNKFKVVETNIFHKSQMIDLTSHYNAGSKESYDFIVSTDKNIEKSKQKIAKYYLKEAKSFLATYTKRVALFTEILNNIK